MCVAREVLIHVRLSRDFPLGCTWNRSRLLLYTLGPSPICTNYHIPVDEAYALTLRRRLVELASAAVDSAQPRKIEWDKAPARLVGALITSYLTIKGVTLVMAR